MTRGEYAAYRQRLLLTWEQILNNSAELKSNKSGLVEETEPLTGYLLKAILLFSSWLVGIKGDVIINEDSVRNPANPVSAHGK